jgi:hypothetical protein
MTTNREVIQAWERGDSARAANLSTDGEWLRSYNLKIGHNTWPPPRGKVRNSSSTWIVFDYTAPGGGWMSQTTSTHVNMAKQVIGSFAIPATRANEYVTLFS